jgi:hypothetical protein
MNKFYYSISKDKQKITFQVVKLSIMEKLIICYAILFGKPFSFLKNTFSEEKE